MFLSILSIFILGYVGYRIFRYLNIPSSAVTASLSTLAIVSSQGLKWAKLPSYLTTFFQVIIGITIGCRFKKEQIPSIKAILIPGLISSAWMIFVSLIVGLLFEKTTGVELKTALYGSLPAGLSEMGLIAISLNLNVPIVTILQFVRVMSISLSLPLIVYKCNDRGKNIKIDCHPDIYNERVIFGKFEQHNEIKRERMHISGVILILLLGSIGGFTAKYLGLPVGGMLGSMIIIGFLNIFGAPLKKLPDWAVLITQIMIGGCIGTTFAPEMLPILKSLLVPILFFSIFVVLNGALLGIIFHLILKWDLPTALLATAAGGITLMTLIAIEINADVVKVSIVQTLRIVIILLIMPTIISQITC
jgi:membrane AbrB-like protein